MFTLSIKTGGSAFRDPATGNEDNFSEEAEVGRLLKEITARVQTGVRSGAIMDINGNKVGEFSF